MFRETKSREILSVFKNLLKSSEKFKKHTKKHK